MVNIKVSVGITFYVIFMLTFFDNAYCQKNSAKQMIWQLYDTNMDSAQAYKKDKVVFVIVTGKNCINCFKNVCNYAIMHFSDHKIYGVVLMPKDLLKIKSQIALYRNEISCVTDFFLYFTKENETEEIRKIMDMPSPQLIVKTGDKYRYIDYASTIKLTETK